MTRRSIVVLGTGPAATFAAWSLIEDGHSVRIVGADEPNPKTVNAGVFYLHKPINLPLPEPSAIRVSGFGGTRNDYAMKLYGTNDIFVSFPEQPYIQDAYDGYRAYALAVDIVFNTVGMTRRTFSAWEEVEAYLGDYEGIVSTLPLNRFFPDRCPSGTAYVKQSEAQADEAYMLYNAHPDAWWYRASAIYGRFVIESMCEFPGASPVRKVTHRLPLPILNHPRILFTGRFGAWDKNKLSHDAYWDVKQWMNSLNS